MHVCFQDWLFGTQQPINVLFHGEDQISIFQVSSVTHGSLWRTEAPWAPPYLLWLVQWYHTCSVHGWAVMLVTLDVASCITRRHNSTENSQLLAFHNFTQWHMGDERPRVSLLGCFFGCEAHWTATNIPNSWQGLLLFLPRILMTPMKVLQRVFKDTKSECKLLI